MVFFFIFFYVFLFLQNILNREHVNGLPSSKGAFSHSIFSVNTLMLFWLMEERGSSVGLFYAGTKCKRVIVEGGFTVFTQS